MMYHIVRVKRDDWGRLYVRNKSLLDGRGKDELATQMPYVANSYLPLPSRRNLFIPYHLPQSSLLTLTI